MTIDIKRIDDTRVMLILDGKKSIEKSIQDALLIIEYAEQKALERYRKGNAHDT